MPNRSERRRHSRGRARRRPIDRDTALAAACLGAALRGCTCEYDVELAHLAPGVVFLDVRHDPDCPALEGAA